MRLGHLWPLVVRVRVLWHHGIRVVRIAGGVERTPRWVAGPDLPQGDLWFTRDSREGDGALFIEGHRVPRFELQSRQDRYQPGDTRPRVWFSVFDRTRPPIDDDWLARAQGWPGVNPFRVTGGLREVCSEIAARLEAESAAPEVCAPSSGAADPTPSEVVG